MGIINLPHLFDSYRANDFKIFHPVLKFEERVTAQLWYTHLQFLQKGDISVNARKPAAVEALQLGDAYICGDDIDHEVSRVADIFFEMKDVGLYCSYVYLVNPSPKIWLPGRDRSDHWT